MSKKNYFYNICEGHEQMTRMADIAIIGAGAAGCFCAAELSRRLPGCRIRVYEAGVRPMAKLAVTGGGRCNLTNTFEGVGDLKFIYPRGYRLMKRLLQDFGPQDTCKWFEKAGVRLVTREGGRIFPAIEDAMEIVRTLGRLMEEGGVELYCVKKVTAIQPDLQIDFKDGSHVHPDAVIVTTGGGTADILSPCGIDLEPSVPSLFTLKIADSGLRDMTGTVVKDAALSLAGTPFRSQGSLLLTDWGISGPATLRLSSYAARHLSGHQYRGTLNINWLNSNQQDSAQMLTSIGGANPRKQVISARPEALTERLWRYLTVRAGLREDIRWAELGSKGMARLASILTADSYSLDGRARWKEEFVTCGGVSLPGVCPQNLSSRKIPGLFFAGEVLDIDAVTGGFNLQAAWTTAHTVAAGISLEDAGGGR